MALAKDKINEVTNKATPVLADSVLISDSEDGGRGKLVTGTALRELVGGGATIEPSGTDDTTALQAAIDAGGIVQLGAGTYIITSVDISNDVIIQGVGDDTIVKLPDGFLTVPQDSSVYGQIMIATHNISVVIRDMQFDGNEQNQTPIDPMGWAIIVDDPVSANVDDVVSLTVSNVSFVNSNAGAIWAALPNTETRRMYLHVDNCMFLDGRQGLPSGHEGCVSPYGYSPDYIQLNDSVFATITNNKFIFTKTLSDGEFSRVGVRITAHNDGALGAEAYIGENYFYRCGRGRWKNGLDELQEPINGLGVVEAYNFGRHMRVMNNVFIDSISSAIRGKTNCDSVVISGNIIKNCGSNYGITFQSASFTEQVGKFVITNNHIEDVSGAGIILVGAADAAHTQDYISDTLISNNTIENVSTSVESSVSFGHGIAFANAKRVNVSGNSINGVTLYGIYGYQTGTGRIEDISITNNHIVSTSYGIFTSTASLIGGAKVAGNTIKSGSYGIYIQALSASENELTLVDNIIALANQYAIYLKNIKYISILGNISRTVSANSRMLVVDTCNGHVTIANNIAEAGTTTGLYLLTGTGTSTQTNNSWNPTISYGTAAPTTGTYTVGDIVYNTAPAPSGYTGWICTTAGTPGTWKGFGLIEA